MIDLKELRENPQRFRKGAADKGHDPKVVDALLAADGELRPVLTKLQELTAEKNRIGKEIGKVAGQLKKAGGDAKAKLQAQMQQLQQRPNEIKQEEEQLTQQVRELEKKRDESWLYVPLPADDDVPIGKSIEDNVETNRWNPRDFDTSKPFAEIRGFEPRSHIELMQQHRMVDFERGVKVAGSRSYCLTGEGMRLHQAVLRYGFDAITREFGFTAVSVPMLVRDELMQGVGFYPQGREESYAIANPTSEGAGFSLAGTGEVGLMGLHADEIIPGEDLPLRYATISTCFRREAGAAGKDTAGLYRIHQFDKVEQVVICKADAAESAAWLEKMIGYVETLLQRLGLPYRRLRCCTGDLSLHKADQTDIECWMPSRAPGSEALQSGASISNGYGETHSASKILDYQCRRLNMRYRDAETGKPLICHSLNNTVVASPRILIPLIEMHQNEDGTITIPEPLRPYMDGQDRIG